MAQVAKRKLSGSTDGRGISIAAVATPGTLIHTAVTGVVAGTWDEIYLYLSTSSATDAMVTVEFGGTSTTTDTVNYRVPANSGMTVAFDGHILQNGVVVRAFVTTGSNVSARGFVNAITA